MLVYSECVLKGFKSSYQINFSCKLLFCKIQIHYRRRKKGENGDLERGKLYSLILARSGCYRNIGWTQEEGQ